MKKKKKLKTNPDGLPIHPGVFVKVFIVGRNGVLKGPVADNEYNFGKRWATLVRNPQICSRGWHVYRPTGRRVHDFLRKGERALYLVQAAGLHVEHGGKLAFQSIRLARRLWNGKVPSMGLPPRWVRNPAYSNFQKKISKILKEVSGK